MPLRRMRTHDGASKFRLGFGDGSDESLRGYCTERDEDGGYVSITVEWGPGGRTRYAVAMTARRWPTGVAVGSVYKAYTRGGQGGGYRQAWNELRRQVLDACDTDIGHLRSADEGAVSRWQEGVEA